LTQRLRDRVRFERLLPGAGDGMGNSLKNWAALFECYARLRPINGREEVLAGKLSGVSPFEVVVRGCSETNDVGTADRAVVVFSEQLPVGTLLDITSVQNTDERGAFINMMVKAGVASG
jgi:head-tail adaptor